MTITTLQREVNKALKKGNCKVKCPVSINNRLTRCLGRAIFTRRPYGGWESVRIEFSGDMVRRATEHSIMEVLLHECAHVVANFRTGENEGHNATFKAVCHELGTYNDKTSTAVEYKAAEKKTAPKARFEVICPICGVVASYSRKCKTLDNIARFRCSKCGSHALRIHENW